jgi:phosphoribosylformylglycinamidine cyclo-ligase
LDRKLARHPRIYTHRITNIPPVPPVLQFMAEQANLDARDSYGSLNMEEGLAVFVPEQDADKTFTGHVTFRNSRINHKDSAFSP